MLVEVRFPNHYPVRLYTSGEDVIICVDYESRSGLHWDECYVIPRRGIELNKVYGPYKHMRTILSLYPSGSPVDGREGKNAVKLTISELKRLYIDLAKRIASILDYRPDQLSHADILLLHSTHDGIDLFWARRYDYLLVADNPVNLQANLVAYPIVTIFNSKGREMPVPPKEWKWEVENKVEISSHIMEGNFYAILFETRYTKHDVIDAALVWLKDKTQLTMLHPEHGVEKVTLGAGIYLILHIRRDYAD